MSAAPYFANSEVETNASKRPDRSAAQSSFLVISSTPTAGVSIFLNKTPGYLLPLVIRSREEVAGRQTAAVSIALWDSHAEILVYLYCTIVLTA